MGITKYFPFRIAISRGSTKVDGNLKWQSRDSSWFGIDKQKELVVLPFRIAISRGLFEVVSNLKGYSSVFSVNYSSLLYSSRV